MVQFRYDISGPTCLSPTAPRWVARSRCAENCTARGARRGASFARALTSAYIPPAAHSVAVTCPFSCGTSPRRPLVADGVTAYTWAHGTSTGQGRIGREGPSSPSRLPREIVGHPRHARRDE